MLSVCHKTPPPQSLPLLKLVPLSL